MLKKLNFKTKTMNAKEEFLKHTENKLITCAQLHFEYYHDEESKNFDDNYHYNFENEKIDYINLPVNYTDKQYQEFLTKIDKNYDSGYGGQELYGTIWYNDGTWSDRGEYDGSEWWEYHKCPEIPKF